MCRLRKAYYSARHEAAVQIDEIVGETASEADSSDSLERDHGHHNHGGPHDKDDDVIRCICGMYKDEGVMIQCEKCMVRTGQEKDDLLSNIPILQKSDTFFSRHDLNNRRFGSIATACAWRPRWSTTCVSCANPGR